MLKSKFWALLVLVACLGFVGCGDADEPEVMDDVPQQTQEEIDDYEADMDSDPIEE